MVKGTAASDNYFHTCRPSPIIYIKKISRQWVWPSGSLIMIALSCWSTTPTKSHVRKITACHDYVSSRMDLDDSYLIIYYLCRVQTSWWQLPSAICMSIVSTDIRTCTCFHHCHTPLRGNKADFGNQSRKGSGCFRKTLQSCNQNLHMELAGYNEWMLIKIKNKSREFSDPPGPTTQSVISLFWHLVRMYARTDGRHHQN